MKENRVYWNSNTCKRIIKAFDQSDELVLSTQQIHSIMMEQRNTYGAKLKSCPTRQSVAQTLNKYPFFEKAGMSREKSIGGNGMNVCLWRISAVE